MSAITTYNTGFIPFKTRFNKLADKYLISFSVLQSHPTLLLGVYTVEPSFCLQIADGCDCRKAILNVYDKNGQHLASIHYGWESPNYYNREFHGIQDVEKMAGFYLEPMCEQSEVAADTLSELKKDFSNSRHIKAIKTQYDVWYQFLTGKNVAEVRDTETAYSLLSQQLYGIPFNAIRFLREQLTTVELTERIIFSLIHAYDETYYDKDFDWNHATPLWYAVVAENHLTETLIEPVLGLFAEDSGKDWDFLSEQGERLLGLLVEKFPKATISKTKKFLNALLKRNANSPYLYTSVVFEHKDAASEIPWLLKFIEHPNNRWKGYFADFLAEQGIAEAIPVLKTMLSKEKNQWEYREIEYAIENLQRPKNIYRPFSQFSLDQNKKYDWEEHFKEFVDRFYPDADDEKDDKNDEGQSDDLIERVHEKIGRNNPCPCGAKKSDGTSIKYKKCHGK